MSKSKQVSPFKPLDGVPGVHIAHKTALRTAAITLQSGGLCLFSPVLGWNETAIASLAAIGPVTHVIAPNHYHNLGLAETMRVFPHARLCCSASAAPRLEKITNLKFNDLCDIDFTGGVEIVEPPGLKSGEIWLIFKKPSQAAWFVTDCFCGPRNFDDDARSDQPELLSTFPKYGLRDHRVYLPWLRARVALDKPKLLVPCHGGIVSGNHLPQKLMELAETMACL